MFKKKAVLVWLVFVVLVVFILVFNLLIHSEQQFFFLAKAFLGGSLSFLEMPGLSWGDTVFFKGRYYWPLGPLPAVLMAPWVWMFDFFGKVFFQSYLNLLLALGVGGLVYFLALKLGYRMVDRIVWVVLWWGGSSLLGLVLAPWSWYVSHMVVVFLLLFSVWVYEELGLKSNLLLGLCFGLILLTRLTAVGGILLFVLLGWREARHKPFVFRIRWSLVLFFPVLVAVLVWGGYNQLRFGSFWEQGYGKQTTYLESLVKAKEYGLFGLSHIPGNLYYMFLAIPEIVRNDELSRVLKFPYLMGNPWGMGLWVTSPVLLWLFGKKVKKDFDFWVVMLTCVVIMVPILTYYGVGLIQYGYRYAWDFLPFLFWLLMKNMNHTNGLSSWFVGVGLVSVLINLYLLMSQLWLYGGLNFGLVG